MANRVYLALGTNLGDRSQNLQHAIHALSPQVRVDTISSVYETDPWGYTNQDAFLNLILSGLTDLSPTDLLRFLKQIEQQMGRVETIRNGPRVIDLDILLFDDKIVDQHGLNIPHKSMLDRGFVLVPLNEIASDFVHPVSGQSIQSHLAQVDQSGVRIFQDSADFKANLRGKLPRFGDKTYIMGILNVTPDSFSGDGLLRSMDPVEAALSQAKNFVKGGAHILDLGAESTRPGSKPVDAEEELARILPVLKSIREAELDAWISIDTYKSNIAAACLDAGADWINDVWAFRADTRMAQVVSERQAPVVLMHNRSNPEKVLATSQLGGTYLGAHYDNLLEDVKRELLELVDIALTAGIPPEHIILDPGIGFGKTISQNLTLIDRLDEIKALDYPVLLGPSRKSFIGYAIGEPVGSRLEGTIAACTIGILRGADILRVHDVTEVSRAARLIDAMMRARSRE